MRSNGKILLPVQPDSSLLTAGVDEVGRGCLAGPVVAAAVILADSAQIPGLRDSKKISTTERKRLAEVIQAQAISYAVYEVSAPEIDEVNILNATIQAMHGALDLLSERPQALLVDGNRFVPYQSIPHSTVVGGDDTYLCIAAASVLAKVYRDQLMIELDAEYPEYDWKHNVGYGTPKHIRAIRQLGITPHHRRSFAPCRTTLFDAADHPL